MASTLLDPDYSLQLAERNVASEYGRFARFGSYNDQDAIRVVELSAVMLELMLLGVCIHEIFHEAGIASAHDPARSEIDFARKVEDRCGLMLDQVARDVQRYLPIQALESNARLELMPLERLVRVLRSSIELFPMRDIERIGSALELEPWVHRARVAHDALRAFLLRNDPQWQRQLTLVGQKYAEGLLTVDEVATLLGIDPVDASFFLESGGFARSLERIRLADSEREQMLEALRADRLRRGGKPAPDSRRVARDAIASERIEDVDARPWIRRPAQ